MNPFDSYKLQNEVIPSPGTEDRDWSAIEKKIELVKPFVKTVHIDVIDGKFASNTSFSDPTPFKKFTKDPPDGEASIFFEVHLMVDNPIQYLKPWADAGFKRFIGHIEKMPDIAEFVAQGQLLGEVGLAIDKQTPVDAIKVSYDDLDVVLVMTIQAGFSGQKFEAMLLEKVKQIREKSASIPIEVDGGIADKTILMAKVAGANRFVSTSFLFSSPDPRGQYEILNGLVKE